MQQEILEAQKREGTPPKEQMEQETFLLKHYNSDLDGLHSTEEVAVQV